MSIELIARERVERCPLCNSHNSEIKFTKNQFNLLCCETCGFFYADSRITPQSAKQLYQNVYEEIYTKTNLYLNVRNLIVKHLTKKRSTRILKSLMKYEARGRILEIGCSTGELLNITRRYGWETYGVELSPVTSRIARDKLSLSVFTGTVHEAQYENAYFDVVVMIDVFSHLLDPIKDFSEVNRILRNNGLLVFVTGNYDLLPENSIEQFWDSLEQDWTLLNSLSAKILLEHTGFTLLDAIQLDSITPKKLNRIGVPVRILSAIERSLFNKLFPFMSCEMMFICKKCKFTS